MNWIHILIAIALFATWIIVRVVLAIPLGGVQSALDNCASNADYLGRALVRLKGYSQNAQLRLKGN
jgi:hypothetical protein